MVGKCINLEASRSTKTHELIFLAANVRNIHVMGGWAEFLELLSSKDVNGNKMDLGVAVFSSLGGGHVNDLARTVLDHDEAVLAQSRALHRIGGRGTGIGAFEGVLLMLVVRSLSAVDPFLKLCLRVPSRCPSIVEPCDRGGLWSQIAGQGPEEVHTWASSAILIVSIG
jgi:hypothetical protein